MRVWLTRDDKKTKEIYVWPEEAKPEWTAELREWNATRCCYQELGQLPIAMIGPLPDCLLKGGRKAIVLVEMTVNEIKEAQ